MKIGPSNRTARPAHRGARRRRRTIERSATIVVHSTVFTVDASTVRDLVGNARTTYHVLWRNGSAAGAFSYICLRVAAEFGTECSQQLLSQILQQLPPLGVQNRDAR